MPITVRKKLNKLEKELGDKGDAKFLYPDAYFVWFIAASGQPEELQRIRGHVINDMNRLGSLGRRNQKRLVAVCTDNLASDVAFDFARKIQGWHALRFEKVGTPNDAAMLVDAPYRVAARTADMVVVYGQPTEHMYELLDDVDPDDPPQLEIRDISHKPDAAPRLAAGDRDPYSAYWQKVERLRRWYKARWDGKPPLREFIRPYPTYNVDGESGVGGMD